MNAVTSKTEARNRRTQNAARYQPKPTKPMPTSRPTVVDIRLKKLTGQVLENLKRPDAIPSDVIYAALQEAAQGRK